ncbi:hypothetical protein ACH5RR_023666 [Cinchona calisaya]|uniref:Uncharacterized protein n=1 Tax=Cinchona calisaya TaxID=153742 RepID=A0ABD2ZBB0_9GENT
MGVSRYRTTLSSPSRQRRQGVLIKAKTTVKKKTLVVFNSEGLRPAETIESQAAHKVTKRISLLKRRRKVIEEIARTRTSFFLEDHQYGTLFCLGFRLMERHLLLGKPSIRGSKWSLRRGPISYLIVGVAIGFASTTAFPAVETLSENVQDQVRSSGLRAWEQLKDRRAWSGLNSGTARPSAARSGRRYAP